MMISDDYNIINTQGIRYVSWGENSSFYAGRDTGRYYVAVTYKGNHTSFNYKTEAEAKALFLKLREAVTK